MRLKACAAALVLACWAGPGLAQDTEQSLAAEVVQHSGAEEMVRTMFRDLAPILSSAMANEMNLDPQQTERLTVILGEELAAATPELVNAAAAAYADTLNLQQLTEIRDFLTSPSGRAMVASQAQLEAHIGPAAERIGREVAVRALQRLGSDEGKN